MRMYARMQRHRSGQRECSMEFSMTIRVCLTALRFLVMMCAWLQEARVELEAVRLKAPRESTVYIALGRVCKTLVRA